MKKLLLILFLSLGLTGHVLADKAFECWEKGDYECAIKEWTTLAYQGDANARSNLGLVYSNGEKDEKGNLKVKQDYAIAVFWLKKAVAQENAKAQYTLGTLYEAGKGVNQDNEKAVSLYIKAAEQSNTNAQNKLAYLYTVGLLGVPRNYDEANTWYRKAAVQGKSANAQYNLGFNYEFARGFKQNYREAISWYRQAANQDHADAQYRLGLAYQNGLGVTKNYKTALTWYKKALDQGHKKARTQINSINAFLKKEAEKKAAEAKKKADEAKKKAQEKAYKEVLGLITSQKITSVDQIPTWRWNKMSLARQDELRKKIIEEETAYQVVLSLITSQKITSLDQIQTWRLIIPNQKIITSVDQIPTWRWNKMSLARQDELRQFFDEIRNLRIFSAFAILVLLFIIINYIKNKAKRDRAAELKRKAQREKRKEEERIKREEEAEKIRLKKLAEQEERNRIAVLQQKKLSHLKTEKYLDAFKDHLPFKRSADYSDLIITYDEDSLSTEIGNIEGYKDNRLWRGVVESFLNENSIDNMSTIYFAKIRSLLDDKNYFVIGETSQEINEFFDRSTQVELLELISKSLMPTPFALFALLNLSREFKFSDEIERDDSEHKLKHLIVKDNAKVKIQKLFTQFDDYALKCFESYSDINSKDFDQLESNIDN